MAPWILLSALGFVVLLELTSSTPAMRAGAVILLLAGITFHSARFVRIYFEDFPAFAAPYFQYGIKEFLQTIDKRYSNDLPVVISSGINQPYIYVLFFERYSPATYQRGPVLQEPGIFGHVAGFDRYRFVPPNLPYVSCRMAYSCFAVSSERSRCPTCRSTIRTAAVAYKIIVK